MTAVHPRPPVRPAPPWAFPEPGEVRLGNGLRILSYDTPGQHILSVRIAVPAPLSAEPRGREGVGALMARLLDEGSDGHTADDMAELLQRHGIAFGAGVVERGLLIDLDVPRRHYGRALELLREMVLEPAFEEQEVRRHIRTRIADIDQEHANPASRAAIAFVASFYDDAERLSQPTGGTAPSVEAITRDDLVAHHAAVLRPGPTVLTVAGDLQGLDASGLATQAFDGWTGADELLSAPDVRRREGGSRIVLVDRPGSSQSELYIGCAGPDRVAAAQWAPFPVLGFILGGSPTARLDAVLREQRGYTYGMRCGFRPRRGQGLFLTSGSVRADVTADALAIAIDILDSGRDGFTDEEVASGVEYLRETAPGRYATADAVADEAAARALEGLTTAHTTNTLDEMRALSSERLQVAYREYVDGEWVSVVVGDAASLEAPLAALGRGRVDVLPA
ncbi:MAG: pitrilysin family protein [Dermatophilaceae bacterium]